jgi:uncharacterized integral membrane protein
MASAQHRSSTATDRKRLAAVTIVCLVAIWLVAFIVSNAETVRVSFVFGHVSLSLIWVMIMCALLGAGLALAIPRLSRRGQNRQR